MTGSARKCASSASELGDRADTSAACPPPRANASLRKGIEHQAAVQGASEADSKHPPPFFFTPPPSEDDTVGDLKKLVAAQTGTRPDKLRIQKWHNVFKVCVSGWWVWCGDSGVESPPLFHASSPPPFLTQDHITLADYEIHDGMGLELYYN